MTYFHVKDGLPDPRGSLSSQLPSQARHVVLANKEVERVLRETGKSKNASGGITTGEIRTDGCGIDIGHVAVIS